MEQERMLYQGREFSLTGCALRQDERHWAEAGANGRVKTLKNGVYREWSVPVAGLPGPQYRGDFPVLNTAYTLALDEAGALLGADGLFRTGANWPSIWTRDISYAAHLGLGVWNAPACMASLRSRVKYGEVEQDTGTGGSWPVSSDRVVWGVAAWEVYCVTGDADWLDWACRTLEQTCLHDEQVLKDTGGLFRGESSFLDWREQSYPEWMTPSDIGDSVSLSTMALHAGARRVLAAMHEELGQLDRAREWLAGGEALERVLEQFFRLPGSDLHGQYLYGRGYPVLSEKVDCLGELLCVLLGRDDRERMGRVVAALPHCGFGIPCFHPQMHGLVAPYHNRATWPFVEGYYARAASLAGNESALALALACMVRAALLCGTNKENLLLETGLDDGLALSSDSQLWSIGGMLGGVYHGLFGLRVSPASLEICPCVPASFAGCHELTGLAYRDMTVDIRLQGGGRKVARCLVNGLEALPSLPADMKGHVIVDIMMTGDDDDPGEVNLVPHTERNLPCPVWKTCRHGISWEAVEGADYYRVYRNGIPVSQTECCHYLPVPVPGVRHYQVMAVALGGRESYLNEPNEYPAADARLETRPCGLTGDEIWTSRVQESPDALFYDVNIAVAGVYRVDAFFSNGMYGLSDGNTCALRSLHLNGKRVGTLAFPHNSHIGDWEAFSYSMSLDVVLKPGPCRVELVYDAFSGNMNRLVNDMVIKHLRFTRMS